MVVAVAALDRAVLKFISVPQREYKEKSIEIICAFEQGMRHFYICIRKSISSFALKQYMRKERSSKKYEYNTACEG